MTFFLRGFALAIVFAAAAFGQQNYVSPTIMSTDGSSLCLAASGSAGNGTPIVVNDCVTGHPSQGFAVGADRRMHFGAATGSYCVGPSSIALQAPLQLWPCASAPAPYPNPMAFTGPTGEALCAGFGNNAPGSRVVMYLCSINSPTFAWTNTITARLPSRNINPKVMLDANGCLLDLQGRPMTGLGCQLFALRTGASGPEAYGVPGSSLTLGGKVVTIGKTSTDTGGRAIVASGAGNIVASGAGNIVASGAGNLQLVKKDGTPVPDLPIGPTNGIVASGAGNIVASGAGNIVASGAGNICSTNGSNLVGPSTGTFTLDALSSGLVGSRGDSSIVNSTAAAIQKLTASTPPPGFVPSSNLYSGAPTDTYVLTGVNTGSHAWPTVGQQMITWTHSGTGIAPHTISLYLQTASQYVPLSTQAISVAPSDSGYITLNVSLPANTTGVLVARDEKTPTIMVRGPSIQVSGPAPTVATYQVTNISSDPSPWAPSSQHRISWGATGTPAAGQVANVYFQTASTAYPWCTAPVSQGYCTATVTNIPAGSTGVVQIYNGSTGSHWPAALTLQIAGAQVFKLTGVTANSNAWVCCSTPYRITWQSTGTGTQNQQVSLWLQVPKSTVFPTGTVHLATSYATQGYYDYSVNTVSLKNVTGSLFIRDESTGLQITGATIQVR